MALLGSGTAGGSWKGRNFGELVKLLRLQERNCVSETLTIICPGHFSFEHIQMDLAKII